MEINGEYIHWNRRKGHTNDAYSQRIEQAISKLMDNTFFVKRYYYKQSHTTDSIYCYLYLQYFDNPVVIALRNHFAKETASNYIDVFVAKEFDTYDLRFTVIKKLVHYYNTGLSNMEESHTKEVDDYDFAKVPNSKNFRFINDQAHHGLRKKKIINRTRQQKLDSEVNKARKRANAKINQQRQIRQSKILFDEYLNKVSPIIKFDIASYSVVENVIVNRFFQEKKAVFTINCKLIGSIEVVVCMRNSGTDGDVKLVKISYLDEIRIRCLKSFAHKFNRNMDLNKNICDEEKVFLHKPKLILLTPINEVLSQIG
ncbi:hypothetical protein [Companilactobacillus ginsenosidimutans]|uniref:Uncharacterized protein n=1 Tax=Companilactobacillus ginsenosidimutans TaxID=1007676 RepID=A0A0H4QIQ5_9LACO|nr:hypothetical protein [Companilactobacillus ginsenosidimutans]AKP68314.1 hypothetical protein ABM34_12705 [Companilactobacillus ginsenosidimutans]